MSQQGSKQSSFAGPLSGPVLVLIAYHPEGHLYQSPSWSSELPDLQHLCRRRRRVQQPLLPHHIISLPIRLCHLIRKPLLGFNNRPIHKIAISDLFLTSNSPRECALLFCLRLHIHLHTQTVQPVPDLSYVLDRRTVVLQQLRTSIPITSGGSVFQMIWMWIAHLNFAPFDFDPFIAPSAQIISKLGIPVLPCTCP